MIYIYICVCGVCVVCVVCVCGVCVCVRLSLCVYLRLLVFMYLHVVAFAFSYQNRDAGLGGVGGNILGFPWLWVSLRKYFDFPLVVRW